MFGGTVSDEAGSVRVMVANSQSLFREAVKAALESQTEMEVVAEACDGVQAVSEARRASPDVALVEAELPNGDGVRTTRLIRTAVPGCRVLVLADRRDDLVLLNAVEAGASGYLTYEAPLTQLIEATQALSAGGSFVPRDMVGDLLDGLIRRRRAENEARERVVRLTPRERNVLSLLIEGADNDRIAQALVISPQTARTHVQNVLAKLEVHSRLEAVAFVVRAGIGSELAGA
jgi:DNA-binding NarL/FixJ family response regulator